jgi:hypothetical protein
MISGTGGAEEAFTGLLCTLAGVTVLEISCGVAISSSLSVSVKTAEK